MFQKSVWVKLFEQGEKQTNKQKSLSMYRKKQKHSASVLSSCFGFECFCIKRPGKDCKIHRMVRRHHGCASIRISSSYGGCPAYPRHETMIQPWFRSFFFFQPGETPICISHLRKCSTCCSIRHIAENAVKTSPLILLHSYV